MNSNNGISLRVMLKFNVTSVPLYCNVRPLSPYVVHMLFIKIDIKETVINVHSMLYLCYFFILMLILYRLNK